MFNCLELGSNVLSDCYIKAEVTTSKQKLLLCCSSLKGLQSVEVGAGTNTQYSHSCFHLLSLVLPTGSNLEEVTVIFTVTTSLVLMSFLAYY